MLLNLRLGMMKGFGTLLLFECYWIANVTMLLNVRFLDTASPAQS